MQRVAAEGGVKWVLFLLELEFSLLRNEGLVALNLLAALQEGMVDIYYVFDKTAML